MSARARDEHADRVGMLIVFGSWMVLITGGLVVMIVLPLAGR